MTRVRARTFAVLVLLSAGALFTCGDSRAPRTNASTGGTPAPGGSTGSAGAGGARGTVSCLEMPEMLPRPPAVTLPCELIPPGLRL